MTRYPVVHFEMPYDDADRAAAFYSAAFGWGMNQFGPEMGHYVTAETSETKDGRPTEPGHINGGLFPVGSADPRLRPRSDRPRSA